MCIWQERLKLFYRSCSAKKKKRKLNLTQLTLFFLRWSSTDSLNWNSSSWSSESRLSFSDSLRTDTQQDVCIMSVWWAFINTGTCLRSPTYIVTKRMRLTLLIIPGWELLKQFAFGEKDMITSMQNEYQSVSKVTWSKSNVLH